MVMPLHRVNVLTGTKGAKVIDNAEEYAAIIKKAQRPLLVLGPRCVELKLDGKAVIEYGVEIAKVRNIPICATSQVKGKLTEMGVKPESTLEVVEIINRLKDPEWKGLKKEGNHDLVIFLGFRTDLGNQGLSTLKHFAPHLKTMTLCKYVYPNADYSLPNFRKDAQWKTFMDSLLENVKKEGE